MFAARSFSRGEQVYRESAVRVRDTPTAGTTIERRIGEHWEFDGPLKCTNHSFEPNVSVTFGHDEDTCVTLVALQDIEKGTQLFFDYTTTETSMVGPFIDAVTGREVRGFKHPSEQRGSAT